MAFVARVLLTPSKRWAKSICERCRACSEAVGSPDCAKDAADTGPDCPRASLLAISLLIGACAYGCKRAIALGVAIGLVRLSLVEGLKCRSSARCTADGFLVAPKLAGC